MSIPICFAIRCCRDDLIRLISVFINTSINCVLMLLFTDSYFEIFFPTYFLSSFLLPVYYHKIDTLAIVYFYRRSLNDII